MLKSTWHPTKADADKKIRFLKAKGFKGIKVVKGKKSDKAPWEQKSYPQAGYQIYHKGKSGLK